GLPQISVTALAQDTQGFLWVGTQNGLARFDGVQFSVFNTANTPALSSNLITALHMDKQQRLWIGTANGLMRYQHHQFTRLDLQQPLQGTVTGFAELSDGTVFVGGAQLYQWHEQQAVLAPVPEHNGPVFQLHQQQDKIWIGAQNGFAVLSADGYQWHAAPDNVTGLQISELALQGADLYLGSNVGLFRWQRGQWQAMPLPDQPADTRIELLYLDPEQRLWAASYDSLYRVQQGQLAVADFALGKPDDFVWIESMLKDKHGNLWLGSHSHGLKRLRRPPTQRFSTRQGIADPYVWAVQPWQQHLLAGTSSGLSLLQHGQFQPLMANQYLPSVFVYSLLLDSQQQLWVGTRAGLSRLDGKTLAWQRNYAAIAHLLVTTLAQEAQRIWVGTNGGLFYLQQDELQQQQVPEALREAKIRIVMADSQQRLWVGTENGLYLRDGDHFERLADMPLSGSFITAVKEFPDGNIFVGSFDQGFVLGQPGRWQWFTEKQGLAGNGVMHAELVENQLLISNFQGFYRVDYPGLTQGRVEQLYMLVDDRRPEAETDSHRCCNGAGSSKGTVHQGRVWYPTLDGVLSLPLQQLIQHGPLPEPVLRSLGAGAELYRNSSVRLAPELRDWHFRFTAPYFVQASSVQFRYQLQGYDAGWVNADRRREAFYTNLPPGRYRFDVQAKVAADYRWSDTVSMDVYLAPYWHETAWARSLLVLLLLLTLWGLYRWRLLALARSQRQLAKLVAERTCELHQANEKLQQMSMQDALTGLHNRHYLDVNIEQILSRSARSGGLLTLALLDLDHFKSINDKLGHQVGDVILKQLADIVRQSSRSADHLIRWGGEEFLLILEHNDDVPRALQRLLQAIKQHPWQQLPKPLTCSVGAVTFSAEANWQQQLQWADQALYWVKQHGRDGYLLLQQGETLPENMELSLLLRDGTVPVHSDKLPLPD
ncbi:MAG TPA: diguanylate cyclase, partial [Rheinheimera sp.]|nr:diguanylate cyclase [Rheinheimera sp.]